MHEPLTTLPDGTIKQISPLNGTQVWTVPGRANRPFVNGTAEITPIDHSNAGRYCSFCDQRYLDSPPEKARLILDGDQYRQQDRVLASQLANTHAVFRVVPNLFPILPFSYWQANHGLAFDGDAADWRRDYLAEPAGREHVSTLAHRLATAAGVTDSHWARLAPNDRMSWADTFFASSHDLIIGHRHFSLGANTTDQLASSGTLSADEHAAYLRLTVATAQQIYVRNPFAQYVSIFQNWLRPAGASFDHLHKQLAAIDQLPVQHELELARLRDNPDLYRQYGIDYAERQNLVISSNDHAVAFAGFGHRYPTIEVHSLSSRGRPWELSEAELRGLSDLIRTMHAASGVGTPCNEEWYYQPPGVPLTSPVRVVLKWRTSTLAGFEGATKIYLNTLSPWALRDRVRDRLASTA